MTLTNLARNTKARLMASMAIPPNPMDMRQPPHLWPAMPYEMGAGGWPIEEPTQQQLDHFLSLLTSVYLGPHSPGSPDYGIEYTSAIKVKQWLKLIAKSQVLARDERP